MVDEINGMPDFDKFYHMDRGSQWTSHLLYQNTNLQQILQLPAHQNSSFNHTVSTSKSTEIGFMLFLPCCRFWENY